MTVPEIRIRTIRDLPMREDGAYVLYWMIAFRRSRYNFSLQRAAEVASELKKPLVVLEALRCDYHWASDRLHRFIIQGMAANREQFAGKPVTYYPYLEREQGTGRGLLAKMSADACLVVTDDFPCFFLPRMLAKAAEMLSVRCEAVDSNGLLPLRAADKVFARAHDFRRYLQKTIKPHLDERPQANPLARRRLPRDYTIDKSILKRWPMPSDAMLEASTSELSRLPLDHTVGPAAFDGGTSAAGSVLRSFFADRFDRYAEGRNDPDDDVSSGFSPYLHFGHLSAHEIFETIMDREQWSPDDVAAKPNGSREGWWGMSASAESFLDELVTWRELGYNMAWQRDDYDQYAALPDWAQATLRKHARDHRPHLYSLEQFSAGETHDRVWNAAQRQLVRDGKMHNYLRMLWGKKILEWTESPEEAADIMIELNNRYAVDGRNPNSYSGIFWVLGRYDRAWGPERPIFGKIRYMSSDNTVRKLKIQQYLEEFAPS